MHAELATALILALVAPPPTGTSTPTTPAPAIDPEVAPRRRAESELDEALERRIRSTRIGFGVGSGLSFLTAAGWFAGAPQFAYQHRQACVERILIDGSQETCANGPGFGAAIAVGVAFTIAGVAFAVIAGTARSRFTKAAQVFRPGGLTLRF